MWIRNNFISIFRWFHARSTKLTYQWRGWRICGKFCYNIGKITWMPAHIAQFRKKSTTHEPVMYFVITLQPHLDKVSGTCSRRLDIDRQRPGVHCERRGCCAFLFWLFVPTPLIKLLPFLFKRLSFLFVTSCLLFELPSFLFIYFRLLFKFVYLLDIIL